jgi:hypothetical protein
MLKKATLLIGIALLAFYLGRASDHGGAADPAGNASKTLARMPKAVGSTPAGNDALADAFERQLSDIPVQGEGRVIKTLPDDRDGSRHQRILLALSDGQSVLIAHNIDLAPRLPDIQPGDRIGFKGEYVWNAKGGVVHWTHRDPDGRHAGGWLRHRGETYQ